MSTLSSCLNIDCPSMPSRLKRQSTDDVDAACQSLSTQYSVRLEEITEDDGGIFGPMKDLKTQYIELILEKVTLCKEDLTLVEIEILDEAFDLFEEKLEDIRLLREENKRIEIELKNLIAMKDNTDY